ncbi:MAG: hypothetical protein COW65_11240 [Cytophagales bacterium CG18_big_fil_WC_8_21_14_2_50_42_9]|nr:MAG: hypothetical protein COW65_11240 [Cytophagales bacterium CG18_big_fil_WC_8_21_14_2_50_42_9]
MDFTKFISLIDSRTLYFTRADKFEDPFEGSLPKINITSRKFVPLSVPEVDHENYLAAVHALGLIGHNWRRFTAINCWHENEHESAAMWKLYLKSDEGIAIQSTYKLLKESIIDEENVYIGKVNYIDYEKGYIDARNILNAFFHKRKSFEHEREIRALIMKLPLRGTGNMNSEKDTIINGLKIKVDVEKLIQNVYIAPNSPQWFSDLVDAVVKKYSYNFRINHSHLNNSPLY